MLDFACIDFGDDLFELVQSQGLIESDSNIGLIETLSVLFGFGPTGKVFRRGFPFSFDDVIYSCLEDIALAILGQLV